VRPENHVKPTEKQLEVWHAACLLAKHEIPGDDGVRQSQLRSRVVEFWMLLVCQDTGSQRYVMGCTRCMNTNEVIRDSGRSGRGNWLSSTLVKLRYDQ
jgi:hypothetical protein